MTDTPGVPGRRPLPPELDPRRGLKSRSAGRHGAPARRPGPTSGLRRYARALSWVATLSSAIVLLSSAGLYAYVTVLDSKITRIGAICVRNCPYDRPGEAGNAQNFLLVGSDSRAGANSAGSLSGLADSTTGGSRSDTTMLVHISANRDKVVVLSFPRDLFVTIPPYKTSTGVPVAAQSAKFNAAFAYGGPKLLVQMIEQDFGLRVDHYVEIDFAGFKDMVNALGGVQVCLSVPAYDPGGDGSGGSGFRMSAGRHNLNGDLALQYVRQRHGLPQGDIDRIQRQQRFLASIIRKVKSAGTLLNPLKLNSFLNATVRSVKLGSTSRDDLLTLAGKMKGIGTDKVQFFTVPTSGGHNAGPIGAVLDVDTAVAQRLFQQIHDDIDPTNPVAPKPSSSPSSSAASSAAAPTLTVPLSRVTVTSVQNGTTTNGLGARAAASLRGLGVHVNEVRTATTTGQTATTIRFGTGRAESAKTLAAAIPGSSAEADPALPSAGLEVIVGSSYSGVHAVTINASSAAPATSAAAPAPAPASPTASAPPAAKPNFNAATADCGP